MRTFARPQLSQASTLHRRTLGRAGGLPHEAAAALGVDGVLVGRPIALIIAISVALAHARHHVLAAKRDWAAVDVLKDADPAAARGTDLKPDAPEGVQHIRRQGNL